MNGDDIPDIAIGAPKTGESFSQGKVYLLWGSRVEPLKPFRL
jgi:hypothetical protein